MHQWPPQAVAPQTIFLAASGILGCCVHEGRVLAAEFEKDGSQILCGRLHDDLADFDATGEEDEVERQLEKFRHLVLAACDGSYGSGIKIFRNEIQ